MKKVYFASFGGLGTKLIPFSSLKARNVFVAGDSRMVKVNANEAWAFVRHTHCDNLYKPNGIKYNKTEQIYFAMYKTIAGE